ncbi:MAG: hypothetical protein JKY03_03695 [Aureispira sp.]|nr:hypothetical protein [Aureispira sp.]
MSAIQQEKTTSRAIGQNLFIAILRVPILSCYGIGIIALVNPEIAFETGFQIVYQPEF